FYINAAEAERGGLAQRLLRKGRILIPLARIRHHLGARELPRRILNRALLFGEFEVHIERIVGASGRVNAATAGSRKVGTGFGKRSRDKKDSSRTSTSLDLRSAGSRSTRAGP